MRYLPDRPLPVSTYVPGRGRRPATETGEVVPTDDWRRCEAYLWGVDLWNHGFPWEAHEAWEGPWRAATDDRHRELLRGLIQCAAARVQRAAGKSEGAATLLARGLSRLRAVGTEPCMGITADELAHRLERYFDDGDEVPVIVLAMD